MAKPSMYSCLVIFALVPRILADSSCRMRMIDHKVQIPTTRPLIIAHRGASGIYPEHTAKAYQEAVDQGANVIECDVTLTKDKVLVCLHENNMKHSTNVESFPEFADRKTSYNISNDYYDVLEFETIGDDWFAVDFTLSELKLLRKKQANGFRNPNFDGQFQITTLEEMIQIVQNASRKIGLHLETKSPRWLNSLPFMSNTTIEELLVDILNQYGYRSENDPCFLQSFEEESLYRLKNLTNLPLVRLLYSEPVNTSNARMTEWAKSFYGIGPWKDLIRPSWNADHGYKNYLGEATDLVERAHQHGLLVHAYTFRNEDQYLAWDFRQDPVNELEMFLNLGVDGMFTDFPSTLKRHLDSKYRAGAGLRHSRQMRRKNIFWHRKNHFGSNPWRRLF